LIYFDDQSQNFHIIYCPRSRKYFGHSPFESKHYASLDLTFASEPTVLASNDDLSLFAEMRAFQKEFRKFRRMRFSEW